MRVVDAEDGLIKVKHGHYVTNMDRSAICKVGKFYPHVVLTMVITLVKTGLGKTHKIHMSWVKLGKTNSLNSKNASCFHILFINL